VALLCIGALSARRTTHATPALGQLVVKSDNREIRRAALVALGRIGISGAESSVLAAINDQSGCIRREAARIVADVKLGDANHALWSRLDHEPYPDVVLEQVRAIIHLSHSTTARLLENLLEHNRPEVREAAITHWPDVSHASVKHILHEQMNDPDWRVRLRIVERLLEDSDDTLFDMFVTAISDPHAYVRQAAVQALGRYSGTDVCVILRGAVLKDSDLWVRSRAVEQLAKFRDGEAGPLFVQLLEKAPPPLQLTMARALGELGEETAREPLLRVQQHAIEEVQEAATWALAQLQTSGPDCEAFA